MLHTEIAIIGGGPAGLTCGVYLADWGHDVVLLDPRIPFEKPCGGGLTPRVWTDLPVTRSAFRSLRAVHRVRLRFRSHDIAIELPVPLDIVSRRELGALLLQQFQRAGGTFMRHRVTHVQPAGDPGWRLMLADGTRVGARYVVFADGVYGLSRKVLGHFPAPEHWTRAVGFLLPGTADEIRIQFWPGLDGYAWVFPRADTLSVGLCETLTGGPRHLFAWLDAWMRPQGFDPQAHVDRYGYLIPAPQRVPDFAQWGPDWVRLGDASGGVDPITREGIFPAVRSAVIAAQALHRGRFPQAYARWYQHERLPDLRAAVRWRRWFYRPGFLGWMFRVVRVPAYARLMAALLVGRIGYRDLWRFLARPGRAARHDEKAA